MSDLSLTRFKRCVDCGLWWPLTREYVYWSKRDGFAPRCVQCNRIKQRMAAARYRKAHPENEQARSKRDYARLKSTDPERARRYSREAARRWRARNVEKARRIAREWAKAHPEILRARGQTRRARKKDAEGEHFAEDLLQMLVDQRGLCAYCEIPMGDAWTVDHMVPLSRDGSNWWHNIALCCSSCNKRKNARIPEEYMDFLRGP